MKTLITAAVLMLTLGLAGTEAFAGPINGTIKYARDTTGSNAYSAGGGGEFKVVAFTGLNPAPMGPGMSLGGVFQTFCLERNEYISMGKTYNWELNTVAVKGGISGQEPAGSTTDPLDARTAYLFTQFWNGTLSSYDVNLGVTKRAADAGELQEAIWYIEGEISSVTGQAATWVGEANDAVNGVGGAAPTWSGIGDVRVLNVYTRLGDGSNGIHRQDHLVLMAPLPPAALSGLALLGVLGLIQVRRRRRLQSR